MTDFWRNLTGEDLLLNLHGDPPYDVVAVADRIEAAFGGAESLQGDWVVEIGSGLGRLQSAMLNRGISVAGAEVNIEAIEESTHNMLVVDKVPGDGTLPAWDDATVRAAYSVTVFQHLPEDVQRRYLVELHRVLKPGARAVIQHVEGDERGPQSRQVTELEWAGWCLDAGLLVVMIEPDSMQPDWTWFTMEKLA